MDKRQLYENTKSKHGALCVILDYTTAYISCFMLFEDNFILYPMQITLQQRL